MPAEQGGDRLSVIASHWHALAERRLAYFTELYRSGRWQRYYSQEHFALRMLDVIKAAREWDDLAKRDWRTTAQPAPQKRDDDLRPAA